MPPALDRNATSKDAAIKAMDASFDYGTALINEFNDQTLMETVNRFVQLVDRDNGVTLGLAFSNSEDDMRRAHEALNAMSPPSDAMGRRTGVEIYEVALDESFG